MNEDFRDILSIFIDEGIEFLLVGAYALAAHGLPRATGDMDLWVHRTAGNAQRLLKALARFGAPLAEVTANDFQTPGIVFQIGIAPRRVDILTSVDGVRFDEAWPEREVVEIEGLDVPIISRAHLIQNKKAVGRPQDRADVARLEKQD